MTTAPRKVKKTPPPIHAPHPDATATVTPDVAERARALSVRLDAGLPMAFTLSTTDGTRAPAAHEVSEVHLARGLADALWAVEQRRKANRDARGTLPVGMLRLLLELGDDGALRSEVDMWKVTQGDRPAPLLVTTTAPGEAGTRARSAFATWLTRTPELDEDDRASLYQQLVKDGLRVTRGTFRPDRWDGAPNGHRDLADMAARALEGLELFPGLGPVRRVVSRELGSGTAELTTTPYRASDRGAERPTSYVVRLRTKTYPGRREPLLVFDLSRRQWSDNLSTFHGKVTLHAFPQATSERRAPPVVKLDFTRSLARSGAIGADYRGLRHHFPRLPEHPVKDGRLDPLVLSHDACPVLAVVRQGRGEQGGATGALEVDRLLAFARASLALETRGLVPWTGLERVPEPGRKEGQDIEEPFKYLFGAYEPDERRKPLTPDERAAKVTQKRAEAELWTAQERARIDKHYGGRYRLLLLHAPNCDDDAREAERVLTTILHDRLDVRREAMPDLTSGPQHSLPGAKLPPAARAALRVDAWRAFLRFDRPEADGVLLIVPKGDGDTLNDPVNKRASKIAILTELGLHAQYLRPMEPEVSDPDPARNARNERARTFDFVRRATRAMQDLAWGSLGMLDPVEDEAGVLTSEQGATADRGFVTALTVVTVNQTKNRKNKAGTIPCALRLDLAAQRTEANLLLASGPTGWLNLRDATVRLLGDTRKMNFRDRDPTDRRAAQAFFANVLDDLQERSTPDSPEVITIDGDTVCPAWPGLYDKYLKLDDLRFEAGDATRSRLQLGWSALTLVRLREQERSPKILTRGEKAVTVAGVRLPTPRWSASETYRLLDADAPTYFSVGSNNIQEVRGMSGFLTVIKDGTSAPLKPHVKTYATPNPLELNVITSGLLPVEPVVHLLSKLRRRYAHYDGWTKLPAPMFFAHIVKDYIPDYDFDSGEDDTSSEAGTD